MKNKKEKNPRIHKNIHLLTISLAILILFTLSTVNAGNVIIDQDNVTGIKGAIEDTTNPGDIVFLTPGTYNKTNNDTNFTISRNITLQGNGPADRVIIDAQGLSRIFEIDDNLNVTFINITFINGNAYGNGGAILNPYNNTSMSFINCIFDNNNITNDTVMTTGHGGAIYNSGKNLTIINSTFINNNAALSGGAIKIDSMNVIISNNNFTSNNARDGGAISIDTYSNNVTISNNDFINNTAYADGAIQIKGVYVTISNNNFTSNNATSIGGAITIDVNGRNTTISNNNFISNNAGDGGAIWTNAVNTTISNNNFTNNYAASIGGAIWTNTGNTIISNNNFTSNNATNAGGAVYILTYTNIVIDIYNSTFSDNNALTGGAVYIGTVYNGFATVNIYNSTFTNNNASNTGGAIRIYVGNNGSADIDINNSTFIDNIAFSDINPNTHGGAISITSYNNGSADVDINNSTFTNNTANMNGGAIFIQASNDGSADVDIDNSTFSDNNATRGGAIYNIDTNVIITGSDFYDNTANYGCGIYNVGNMLVSGNTMERNTANNNAGNEIYNLGNMGILYITYINNETINVTRGGTYTLFANLTDDMGNFITGQLIHFFVNGKYIGNATVNEGYAFISYTVPLDAIGGLYSVYGDYDGQNGFQIISKYGQLRLEAQANLLFSDSTVNALNTNINKAIDITGVATDEKGNPLGNVVLNVVVDGEPFTVTTDNVGYWSLPYTPTKVGILKVVVSWIGDSTHYSFVNSTQFSAAVSGNTTPVNETDPVKNTTKKIKTITKIVVKKDRVIVTLTDVNGNALAYKKLTVTIGGKTFTGVTDKNGQLIISFNNADRYTITAKFAGNNQYYESDDIQTSNPSENQAASNAAMEKTGIPIIAVLLVLLTMLCTVIWKKQN